MASIWFALVWRLLGSVDWFDAAAADAKQDERGNAELVAVASSTTNLFVSRRVARESERVCVFDVEQPVEASPAVR